MNFKTLLIFASIFIVVWSMHVFNWRADGLDNKAIIDYHDHVGPVALVLSLLAALVFTSLHAAGIISTLGRIGKVARKGYIAIRDNWGDIKQTYNKVKDSYTKAGGSTIYASSDTWYASHNPDQNNLSKRYAFRPPQPKIASLP